MKKVFLFLALSCSSVFASEVRTSGLDAITVNNPLFVSTVQTLEANYGVQCPSVTNNNVQWRCTGASRAPVRCGFTVSLSCESTSGIGGKGFSMVGMLQSGNVDVISITFSNLR